MKDSFAGYRNLGWHYFFQGVSSPFHFLLAFRASVEKSALILMGLSLQVTQSLSLAAFNVLSFFTYLMF
jgi:hypothetical protein